MFAFLFLKYSKRRFVVFLENAVFVAASPDPWPAGVGLGNGDFLFLADCGWRGWGGLAHE